MSRKICLIGSLCCLTILATAQKDHPIYRLEERIMNGDKDALIEIAPFFDNKDSILEFLGAHALYQTLSSIARRIVEENSNFTEEEYRIADTSTWKGFRNFLQTYNSRITFSRLINAFVCSPLESRTVRFEIRAISPEKKKLLKNRSRELLAPEWIHTDGIDSLLKKKDPYFLVMIASGLCKTRNRWNRYPRKSKEYLDLLSLLTETEIAVEGDSRKLSPPVDMSATAAARYNLLFFYLSHYKEYKWHDDLGIFIHPDLHPAQPSKINDR